jgi:hypothetical protein
LPIRNGHNNNQFAEMPYLDATWAGFGPLQLGAYIDKTNARWALITGSEIAYTAGELTTRYELDSSIGEAVDMVIGERSRLRYLLRRQEENEEKDARVLFDFESEGIDDWNRTGTAFKVALASDPKQGAQGVIGQRFLSSIDPDLGDAATGRLTSPPFVIDRPHLALRIGGSSRVKTRVVLRVAGRRTQHQSGIFDFNDTLLKIVWDVSAFTGQQAELLFIDDDNAPQGRLLCDHVILY